MENCTTTGQMEITYLKDNFSIIDESRHQFYFNFLKFDIPKSSPFMDNKQKSNEKCSYTMKEKSEKFAVNFWQLSEKVRMNFDKDFTAKLFDSCGLPLKGLAKKLNISYPFVVHLRRNLYSIPSSIILPLSNMSHIPLLEIQKNITSIRTRAGNSLTIAFPIKENTDIAALVGHVFGDGYVGKNKKQFEYSNKNPELLKEVRNQVYSVFGILPMTQREDRIGYPAIVGEILEAFGAPIAPKIHSEKLIPQWIKMSVSRKKAFIKAFFDDDGSVMFSESYRAKGVNLNVIRHIDQKDVVFQLLEQIRTMLEEFGIYPGKPKIARTYEKEGGTRVVVYINITDYMSLINFHKHIGLTDGEKFQKLEKIVNKMVTYSKGNERGLEANILEYLDHREKASTAEVAQHIQKSKAKALKKLKLLKTKGLVRQIGKIEINRSYMWSIKGGDVAIE